MPRENPLPEANSFETWIFDLDNTLYQAATRVFDQIDARMKAFIGRELGLSPDDAFKLQKQYFHAHGTTLRGLMLNHGTDPDAFLDFVHDIDHSVLQTDARLAAAIAALPGRKLVFTNGTHHHAERTIDRLGLAHLFDAIFDIRAANYIPKPSREPYDVLIAAHNVTPSRAIMFEDSTANLKVPADLGMTTVWVRHDATFHRHGNTDHCHHVTEDLSAWLEDLKPLGV
ncbi:MAG: pyrimidine 5'-nucleotidase [Rhodospirillaceae bacterium]|nr:pyrimidine 5'-nucleotidase [Rhodospirillaceae bacterium]